ncbi:hypothetical protein E2C01_088168 [Portunus trituberculatus]|uniref:Uncharacterized protein n=1 Tax=Portunus trituberculatus TaxID=210409 RepID=A0A5B7JA18_PORTR|nr:hypothetical protein [Portunus trituberculatus]
MLQPRPSSTTSAANDVTWRRGKQMRHRSERESPPPPSLKRTRICPASHVKVGWRCEEGGTRQRPSGGDEAWGKPGQSTCCQEVNCMVLTRALLEVGRQWKR